MEEMRKKNCLHMLQGRNILRASAAALMMFSMLPGMSIAEDQSVLTNAQVSDQFSNAGWTGDKNSVIGPGFKSIINLKQIDPRGDGSSSQEVQIDLGEPKIVASIFISNFYSNTNSKRFGPSKVWVGNDGNPFSTSLTQATAEVLYDGGFINFIRPLKGRYVVLRRDGLSIGGHHQYTISEIKVYGINNLLQYGATILQTPDASDTSSSGQNLIQNLQKRSPTSLLNPIIDSTGARASFGSCLKTTDVQLGPKNDQFIFSVDLGKKMMVHAVLVAQDVIDGRSDAHTNQNQYFQNFEIFIGSSNNWLENPKCPGGPFMSTDAGSDGWYFDERINPDSKRTPADVWTYGIEVWCNMQGQYVSIVADLSHLTGAYEMSLCGLGIMGASYIRDKPLPEVVEVYQGTSMSVSIPHIYDEFTGASFENQFSLRMASDLSFVSITGDINSSIVSFDPNFGAIGEYWLVLESYETQSEIQITFKTDYIKIVVLEQPVVFNPIFQHISAIEPSDWVLDFDREQIENVQIEPPKELESRIIYEELTQTMHFNGNLSSENLQGQLFTIRIKLITWSGKEYDFVQVISFLTQPEDEQYGSQSFKEDIHVEESFPEPVEDNLSQDIEASQQEIEQRSEIEEIVDQITLKVKYLQKRFEGYQVEAPKVMIKEVTKSGQVKLKFTNNMSNTFSDGGDFQHVIKQLLEALKTQNMIQVEILQSQDSEITLNKSFDWKIANYGLTELQIDLLFEQPAYISSQSIDLVKVTFPDTSLLFDEFGQRLETGTTVKKQVPPQFQSETEQKFFENVSAFVAGFETNDLTSDIILNAIVAATWQQLLSPIASHQIIMFVTLFDVTYPAAVEYFCRILLEVAAFDAVPAEEINQELWGDTLQLTGDDEGIGKFERLGYDGPFTLANLTSTLVMFILILVINITLFTMTYPKCCYLRSKKYSKVFLSRIFWNRPIQFLADSYSVIVICCILNFFNQVEHENIETKTNMVSAVVLFIFISLYPVVMYLFLARNKENLKAEGFMIKFSSAYDGLKTDSCKLMVYPILFLYRRLTIPMCILLLKDKFVFQFLWIQLTGSIIICQVLIMKPFVQAFDNLSIVIEELTVILLIYIVLCFTDWIQDLEIKHTLSHIFITIVMSILFVYYFARIFFFCKWIYRQLKVRKYKQLASQVQAEKRFQGFVQSSIEQRKQRQEENQQEQQSESLEIILSSSSSSSSSSQSSSQNSNSDADNSREDNEPKVITNANQQNILLDPQFKQQLKDEEIECTEPLDEQQKTVISKTKIMPISEEPNPSILLEEELNYQRRTRKPRITIKDGKQDDDIELMEMQIDQLSFQNSHQKKSKCWKNENFSCTYSLNLKLCPSV